MDRMLAGISMRDAATALMDLVMPRCCTVCRRPLMLREHFICLECMCDLPLTHYWEREHNPMADKFNERIQEKLPDGSEEPYALAASLFFYNSESPFKRIPQHLKYENGIRSGRYFSKMLGEKLSLSGIFNDVDAVIPVPLHWTRRLKRGYNQSEVISLAIAEALGGRAAVRTDILRRRRMTRTQTKLSMEEKGRNVNGAFVLKRIGSAFTPRHILLVDDTFTTGATLNACRIALRERFDPSVKISVVTLAFVNS